MSVTHGINMREHAEKLSTCFSLVPVFLSERRTNEEKSTRTHTHTQLNEREKNVRVQCERSPQRAHTNKPIDLIRKYQGNPESTLHLLPSIQSFRSYVCSSYYKRSLMFRLYSKPIRIHLFSLIYGRIHIEYI